MNNMLQVGSQSGGDWVRRESNCFSERTLQHSVVEGRYKAVAAQKILLLGNLISRYFFTQFANCFCKSAIRKNEDCLFWLRLIA